jgi:uncharacterized alkaline shock family protein YloU
MTGYNRSGKTTVAPDVLISIARMSALEVPGVRHMAPVPGGVNRLFRRGASDGVQLNVVDGVVSVDLYVVLDHDINIREVSRNLQGHVARAIGEMMGMDVGSVNVHIEDISYEGKNEA